MIRELVDATFGGHACDRGDVDHMLERRGSDYSSATEERDHRLSLRKVSGRRVSEDRT